MRSASAIPLPLLLLPLFLFSALPQTSTAPAIPPLLNDQVLGLIVFKAGLRDPTSSLSSWTPDDPSPCSWSHLTCSSSSSVVSLSLSSLSLSSSSSSSFPRGLEFLPSLRSLSFSSNNLSCPLPSPFPSLPHISSLSLSYNSLSGTLPSSLFSPTLRLLDLSSNLLYGPIPSAVSLSPLLLHLNLSCNRLSGDISSLLPSLPRRLRVLDLSYNSLSGPLPDSIASLRRLKLLNLSGNSLSGRLPLTISFLPQLLSLDLAHNQFRSDQSPGNWLPRISTLRRIDLSCNALIGVIPANLSALRDLTFLDLSFNSLSGVIPATLAGCLELTDLRLRGNAFNGSIPLALFSLALQVLDLAGNQLAGAVPPGSAKLAAALQRLDLSGNWLTGEIPPETALFSNLRYLNLSWNQLHSRLPPELGNLRNLFVLDLRSSGLYGPIPCNVCDSGSLTVLQLDGNSLSGPIPKEISNCFNLHLLSLSHNKLDSAIPAAMADLKMLEILKLEFNFLSGEIPRQLGSLTNLVAVNISNNRLTGRLPTRGVFPSLDRSALQGNLGLCSPLVSEPCKMDDIPKPLVLDPHALNQGNINNSGRVASASSQPQARRRSLLSISAIIAIVAAFVILLGVLVVTLLNISTRRRLENALDSICPSSPASGSTAAIGKLVMFGPKSSDLVKYSGSNLTADAHLSKSTEIGRGTFGIVFRAATASNGGVPVAIRKLPANIVVQNHEDFDREVRALAKVRHPNLVAVKGYYFTPQLQLLITEFAAGGSLQSRLHGNSGSMSWAERFNVALSAARGLAHLHRACRPPVIHYNVKPSNVLLDADGNAMVADFGLARLLLSWPDRAGASPLGGRFGSSMGYAAPELACGSMRVSEKCDVYGFGVLLLELVTGRQAVEVGEDDVVMLVDEVRTVLERGDVTECVDRNMAAFAEEEAVPVLKLGLVCASQIPSNRPTMAEVVQILQVIKAPVVERMAAFS